ncbi:SDR family NAD(P)-dependent oxidoreductase [Haloglomus litoreum]|uniref:SDR family NAD(P)-dependent oxidoreductase n=1 Tax=Haloglomus litoreum TaxID=3034026 RepID=UPI0023E8365D|nr:SDR family NAD(P)-dependent oxidoreductase [Haloglomus sp. DT116]
MLEDTTALVTGASQGIGREIATTFGGYGANVVCAARSADAIDETAAAVTDAGGEAVAVETDVTAEDDVAAVVEATVDEFGGLDCLVNNAGIGGPVQPVHRIDADAFRRTQEVNVVGPFLCAKHAEEHLRESDRGSVINIGSIGGKRPYPNRLAYAASKMALVGMTRTLAYELGRDGVTVNTVLPGPIEGPRVEEMVAKQAELAGVERAEPADIGPDDFALAEFMLDASEVAEQVAYLASERGRHITAQEIGVDAGGTWY